MNRALAAAAQKLGVAMGVGSQRAMLLHPEQADSYRVRDVAPDILLLANLGAVQARESGTEAVAALVRAIGADALCVHLNVGAGARAGRGRPRLPRLPRGDRRARASTCPCRSS